MAGRGNLLKAPIGDASTLKLRGMYNYKDLEAAYHREVYDMLRRKAKEGNQQAQIFVENFEESCTIKGIEYPCETVEIIEDEHR